VLGKEASRLVREYEGQRSEYGKDGMWGSPSEWDYIDGNQKRKSWGVPEGYQGEARGDSVPMVS